MILLGKSVRGVCEIERPVGLVHEIIGTVEPFALIALGQHGQRAIALESRDTAVAGFADGQSSLRIKRKAIRADVRAGRPVGAVITAMIPEHGYSTLRHPLL